MKGYKNVGLPKPPNMHCKKEKKRNLQFWDNNQQSKCSKQESLNRLKKMQQAKRGEMDISEKE